MPPVPSTSTLRVAFLLDHFPKISETFVLDQITGLLDRGHDVRIFARAREDTDVVHADFTRYRLAERCRYQRQPAGRERVAALRSLARVARRRPAAALRLVRGRGRSGVDSTRSSLLRAAEPFSGEAAFDCIHAHFGPIGRTAQQLRTLGFLNGPLITSFHGYDVNVLPRRMPRDYYADLFHHGDLFTVNSSFLGSRLVALGCPADRIVRLPMGIEVGRLPFVVRVPPAVGPIRLLSVGRLVEVKGFEYGLRAVALARGRGIDMRYTIVGDGVLRSELQRLAHELGIADIVDFVGWQPRDAVLAAYRGHHLFVQPGVAATDGAEEAQGVALLEAQATGMPVIATRTGGMAESVADPDAWLVPQRDADALAARLVQLCRDHGTWGGLGRAGRQHVEREFDRPRLTDVLVHLYRSASGQEPAAARQLP